MSLLNDILGRVKPTPAAGPAVDPMELNGIETFLGSGLYTVEAQNWYSAKPYGFKVNLRAGGTIVMFLPINPTNLTINTQFATNIISTLYGTVEEHSDVRYFDITIEGTTGITPRFVTPQITSNGDIDPSNTFNANKLPGRASFSIAQGISFGGFFAKTLGTINQIKNKASDLLNGSVKPITGINAENSGYVAFHNLYRVLLQYKKDTSGSATPRKTHPLTFFNYKDNNQYDVAVRSFTLRRSAQDPTLYNYSIQLRGYNLKSISKSIDEDLSQRLKDLGLNGVDSSSILGDIKSLSNNVKSIIGPALGGINILGR